MKKYILLASTFFAVSYYTSSQIKWTLRQCIEYAVENNIDIMQQAISVENAEINLSTSKNSRLPNLNANVRHTFNFGRVQSASTNVYEKSTDMTSYTDFTVSSSTPLFTGFRITNEIKANELNLLAAIEGLAKARENLELQVTSYYLDVLFKKEIYRIYTEQAALSRQQVARTEVLVESGKVPLSQLYDIRAQLARDEMNITTAENDLNLSLLNLAQALNLQNADGFDIVEPYLGDVIEENISSILPPNQIYNIAVSVKPHVKEAQYSLESSRKSLKVAESGYWPSLDLSLSYYGGFNLFYSSKYSNQNVWDQVKDSQREAIGFSLSIPIFNRFQVRNQVRTARLQIRSNELVLDNVKLNLYKEIQQAYQSAVAAQAKYVSTEKAYEASAEAYKYAEDRYELGKSTVYEFSEAQTNLLASKSEQVQAKYDFLFRAKILDFYRGEEIDIQ